MSFHHRQAKQCSLADYQTLRDAGFTDFTYFKSGGLNTEDTFFCEHDLDGPMLLDYLGKAVRKDPELKRVFPGVYRLGGSQAVYALLDALFYQAE